LDALVKEENFVRQEGGRRRSESVGKVQPRLEIWRCDDATNSNERIIQTAHPLPLFQAVRRVHHRIFTKNVMVLC
jgi:hypothetical protein